MATALLEKYSKRMKVAESLFAKNTNGARMDGQRKLMVATCLDNVNKFLTEALDNSVGTQRGDLGLFRKFSMDVMNVALPTLIAPDLVITKPMTSRSGYITYLAFTAGSNKGNVTNGIDENGDRTGDPTRFNSALGLGAAQSEYTSSLVRKDTAVPAAADSKFTFKMKWSPVVKDSILFSVVDDGTTTWYFDYDGVLYASEMKPEREEIVDRNGNVIVDDGRSALVADGDAEEVDGAVILYGTTRDDRFNANRIPASISIPSDTEGFTAGDVVALTYNYKTIVA